MNGAPLSVTGSNSGGERLDRFMARANATYYATRDPFADFTTAPEISQAFGECLGLWAAVAWEEAGRPRPTLLAEAGPGRGTLTADARRAIAAVAPDFAAAAPLHLIETSPRLRAVQAATLGAGAIWHDRLETLPDGALFLIANEFLDALPIRQFVRHGPDWAERFVCDGRFAEHKADPPAGLVGAEGAVVEYGEAAQSFVRALAARLARHGGAALLIDYAAEAANPAGSLQALRAGVPAEPLAAPGEADLTAHVDFAALAAVAREVGVAAHGPIPQGLFLTRLGLPQRVARLAAGQAAPEAARLAAGARRLLAPYRMGVLFKVLVLCHPDAPPPPGVAA